MCTLSNILSFEDWKSQSSVIQTIEFFNMSDDDIYYEYLNITEQLLLLEMPEQGISFFMRICILKENNMKTLEIEKYLKQGETLVLVNGKWNIFVPDGFGHENYISFASARELLTYLKG